MIHILSENQSINQAIAELKAHPTLERRIHLAPGNYKEQVVIDLDHLILEAEDPEKTIITGNLFARMPADDIGKLGTFRTYTLLVDAAHVTLKNITIENTAGPGHEVGQAIALYADGDNLIVENCRILGHQDTLFTGPLPPKEIEPNGFVGPKQFAPRINGHQTYINCYICGDIDFIFGSATATFESCTIESLPCETGYITAASTPEGQDLGYLFNNCRFVSSVTAGSVYLGRPWRNHAKTIIQNSYLDAHINPKGWHDWHKPDAHASVFYAEVNNHGPGAGLSHRPYWIKKATS